MCHICGVVVICIRVIAGLALITVDCKLWQQTISTTIEITYFKTLFNTNLALEGIFHEHCYTECEVGRVVECIIEKVVDLLILQAIFRII